MQTMLRVTVELLPGGNERLAQVLGVFRIWNDETGTESVGNYVAERRSPEGRILKRVAVVGHGRRYGWPVLLLQALEALVE